MSRKWFIYPHVIPDLAKVALFSNTRYCAIIGVTNTIYSILKTP